nr:hypothetical protein [Tanacetum cinerariifolium]
MEAIDDENDYFNSLVCLRESKRMGNEKLHDLISLSKTCRLLTELEALGKRGDAGKSLENIRVIVVCNFVTLGDLEQLLARAQVGVSMRNGYVADMEEKK